MPAMPIHRPADIVDDNPFARSVWSAGPDERQRAPSPPVAVGPARLGGAAMTSRTRADEPTGYPDAELDAWARRTRVWCRGGEPDDLPRLEPAAPASAPRDVFVYFISGAKERAPAAAQALLQRLGA